MTGGELTRPLLPNDGHTWLTWMADTGVPLHVLREIAGHGSPATTQRYLHPDLRSITEAGCSLGAHLSVAAGPPKPPGVVRRVL
ncbi:tyrosine-type recombinase/integrase [Streptomyces sp. SS8]